MKYILMHIVLLVLLSTVCFTGERSGSTILMDLGMLHSFSKIGVSSWGSGGTGIVEQGLCGSALNNPACIDFPSLTASIEGGARIKTKAYFDTEYENAVQLPSLASIGMKAGDFNLEAGYIRFYDYLTTSKGIIVTTPEFPEGTGEYFGGQKVVRIHTLFGGANFTTDKMTGGITAGINLLTYDEELFGLSTSDYALGGMLILGALFKPIDKLNIGATVKYNTPTEFDVKFINESYRYRYAFPWIFETGVSLSVSPDIKLLSSVEFQNWKDVSDNVRNLVQVHCGSIVTLSKTDNLRFGFFTQTDPSINFGEYFDQVFLTGGIETAQENWNFSLSLLDSHLFKNKEYNSHEFHQTMIMVGVSYSIE